MKATGLEEAALRQEVRANFICVFYWLWLRVCDMPPLNTREKHYAVQSTNTIRCAWCVW